VAPKLFLKNFEFLFLEKYQHLYKASMAQSLPIVEFYHWLKYLDNFQSHPVHTVFAKIIIEKLKSADLRIWHLLALSGLT
jgi:hypothetical protein